MKKKLLLNTLTSMTLQVVTLICGFVLPRFLLGQFGSEVNGLTQSIKQFLGIITFLELGVGQVIQSALYKPLAERNNDEVSRVLASGEKFFRRIAFLLAGYVLLLTVVYPLIANQRFGWMYTAALIVAMSVGSFAQYYFGVVDNLLLNADQKGYIQYTSQIITILLNTLASVWMIRMGCTIHFVKLTSSVVFLARPMAVRYYIRKHYQINRRIRYEGEPIKQKWNGVAQHVSAVVLEGTDTIVLTICSTLANVSIYSVYFMVITGIRQFYQTMTAGLQAAVGALWVNQDKEELRHVFYSIETVLHGITVFLFSCTGILIVPFVRVYTAGLTDANYIQPIFANVLVLAYAVRCLRTPYNMFILAAGHYKQVQQCHVVAAVLNVVISVVAVYTWGLVGIAIGTLAALLYQTLWMVLYDAKYLVERPMTDFVKQIAVDGLTIGLIYAATGWIKLGSITYAGWLVMALKVGSIAVLIVCAIELLLYRNRYIRLHDWFKNKRKKL